MTQEKKKYSGHCEVVSRMYGNQEKMFLPKIDLLRISI